MKMAQMSRHKRMPNLTLRLPQLVPVKDGNATINYNNHNRVHTMTKFIPFDENPQELKFFIDTFKFCEGWSERQLLLNARQYLQGVARQYILQSEEIAPIYTNEELPIYTNEEL